MDVSGALSLLDCTRVIWIDDCFNITPQQFATVLTNSLETTEGCGFEELNEALGRGKFSPDSLEPEIAQILADLTPDRFSIIRAKFYAKESESKEFKTDELSDDIIQNACTILGVAEVDRWTFEDANKNLAVLCQEEDKHISYVVDLNQTGGSDTRGLEILKHLNDLESSGTAFILTHESDSKGESAKEDALRQQEDVNFPVCVISKERLNNIDAHGEALMISVKRASLRKSMHEILSAAQKTIKQGYDDAIFKLLSIPPEQLDKYAFQRGHKEGVSELHVVERALTSHMSKTLREFFATDSSVVQNAVKIRALKAIDLPLSDDVPHANLNSFRKSEIWETDQIVNASYSPIACGDVFEIDTSERETKDSKKRFVVLGQTCDISLRWNGKRQQDTAWLVELKVVGLDANDSLKKPLLPFVVDGHRWACDFRSSTTVNLSILDLASFRVDGRVRLDKGHRQPEGLLAGLKLVYKDRTDAASEALEVEGAILDRPGSIGHKLQLSFSSGNPFHNVCCATYYPASKETRDGEKTEKPVRLTWRLRRSGRLKMPFSGALLSQYLSVLNRQAFDMDYLD